MSNAAPEQTTAPSPAPVTQDDGGEFLDFSALPEDVRKTVEPRMKKLYWNLKERERGLQDLGRKYVEVESKYQELHTWKTQQEQQKDQEELSRLKAAKVEALEKADYRTVAEIDEKLIEKKSAPEPVRETAPELNPDEKSVVNSWAAEVDERGQFKRPYAQPQHPQYRQFLGLVQRIANSVEFSGRPVNDILKEADRVVMQSKPSAAAAPPSTTTRPPSKNNVELTPEQKRVAERMFFFSKVEPTREKAWERYRKVSQ